MAKSSNNETILADIPKTGRIGRLIKILENQTDEETFLKIVKSSPEYSSYNSREKALWWKNAINRMENLLGEEASIEIMHKCGAKCCGIGQRKTAKKLMKETGSLEKMIENLNSHEHSKGKFKYQLINANTVKGQYYECFCGQVNNPEIKHDKDTYCQCTVEFNKQFFMAALKKPVEAELKKSILSGDDCCEFEVTF